MKLHRLAAMVGLFLTVTSTFNLVRAQGTAFTYQGRLNDANGLSSGTYDMEFTLFATNTTGMAVTDPVTNMAVLVSNGLFTATMDFGGVFDGNPRWLEIAVRTNGAASFATLTPRQQVTPTPYAITAGNVTGVVGDGSLTGGYRSTVAFTNPADQFAGAFTGDGSLLDNVNAVTLGGLGASSFWQTTGNSGTSPQNGNFLGTLDNEALEFWVNDARGLRIEPASSGVIGTVGTGGPVPKDSRPDGDSTPNIIGGGSANYVYQGAQGSVISGGGAPDFFLANSIGANFSAIGGGQVNFIQSGSDYSAVGGGGNNQVQNGQYEYIGGGSGNILQSDFTGANNIQASAIAGGNANAIYTDDSFIGGGLNNSIQGNATYSGIIGGNGNIIQSGGYYSTIGGGSNNICAGLSATIPGGSGNVATNYAFAAGNGAQAVHDGSFVWADSQAGGFSSTTNDQVSFRCLGGVIFASGGDGPDETVSWTPGSGSWSFTSDRNAKENFQPLDVQGVLQKVAELPLTEWNYKGHGDRHVGPMAQDFHAAFPFNDHDKMLNSADEAGVTLAAIQGLNQKLETEAKAKDAKIGELEKRLNDLEQAVQLLAAKK